MGEAGSAYMSGLAGAAWKQPIPADFYFSGEDITSDARVHGLVSMHFACYGLGTPQYDEFANQAGGQQEMMLAITHRLGTPPRDFVPSTAPRHQGRRED